MPSINCMLYIHVYSRESAYVGEHVPPLAVAQLSQLEMSVC